MRTKFIFGLTIVAFLCACRDDRAASNEAIARKVFEYFNAHDWERMASLYAENAEFLDPSLGREYIKQTHAAIVEKYQGMHALFPDIRDEVVGVYPSGDVVTVEFVSTGSMNDSVSFRLPIVSILTIRDGLIIRDATYYDNENP